MMLREPLIYAVVLGIRAQMRNIQIDKMRCRDRWRMEEILFRLKDFARCEKRNDNNERDFGWAIALAAIVAFWG